MIDFFYENDFKLTKVNRYREWLQEVILEERREPGEINYIFCNDTYLLELNKEFLNHDTLTDIITFDNSLGKQLHGEIYISTERVKENAVEFHTSFPDELSRVIVHGILHLCGYKDKSKEEEKRMRAKENYYLDKLEQLSH